MSSATPRRMAASSEKDGIFRQPERPGRVISLAVSMFLILIVVGFALVPGHDLTIVRAMNTLHTGWLGAVTTAIYFVFEPLPSIILTAVIAAMIWKLKDLRTAAAFAGLVAFTWIPSVVIKEIVHRPRPDIALMPHPFLPVQTDPSFPSGHTAFMVALFVALTYVVRGTRWHLTVVTVGTLVTACLALALAIDAVHYPTDILASIAWSLTAAPAARVVWVDWILGRRLRRQPRRRSP